VILAASIKPEDAASNLAAWAHWMGIHNVPEWMSSPSIDHLSVGTDHSYCEVTKWTVVAGTKVYKSKLHNLDRSKTVSNCKVQITSIGPRCEYRGPSLLEDGILLPGGDHIFLPLARYNELRNPEQYSGGDNAFTICAKTEAQPLLGIESKHVLTIRATAPDRPYCEMRCKLWVDKAGRFQIERA